MLIICPLYLDIILFRTAGLGDPGHAVVRWENILQSIQVPTDLCTCFLKLSPCWACSWQTSGNHKTTCRSWVSLQVRKVGPVKLGDSLKFNTDWWQLLGWAPWYPHYLASSYLMFWSNLEKMELQEKNVSVTLRFGLTPPRRATSVESSWWYLSFHSARCSSSTLTCSSNWEKALRQTRWLSRWS